MEFGPAKNPNNTLSNCRPDLLSEWDYERNSKLGLDPDVVLCGSGKRAWWHCSKCGHEWFVAVANRARNGTNCPKCKSVKVGVSRATPKHGKSLADLYPSVAAEWHPTKNGDLKPCDVKAGSAKKVWWMCERGHEWMAVIGSRANKNNPRKCPYCSNKKMLIGYNDFATRFPDIARQWHPTKNGDLKPSDIMPHSKEKVWWVGDCGHEWKSIVRNRVSVHSGCPICDKRRRLSFPEIALFLYVSKVFPDAESEVTPDIEGIGKMSFDIWIPSIRTVIEYDGEQFHKRLTRDSKKDMFCSENDIRIIRIRESGCAKYESNAVMVHRRDPRNYETLDDAISEVLAILDVNEEVDVDTRRDMAEIHRMMHLIRAKNNIEVTHPEVAAEWDYDKNEGLSPWMFSRGSKFDAWWICSDCGESYKTQINTRCVSGCGCPKCWNMRKSEIMKIPKPGRSLAEKSPELIADWHPTANGDLTPSDVYNGSRTRVVWKCHACGYVWSTKVRDRGVSKSRCLQCHVDPSVVIGMQMVLSM